MRRLTYTAVEALLKKLPTQRMGLMDGGVPGLMLRIGPRGATWSMRIRVVGEGGVTNRGHQKKGGKSRLTIGEYPATSIEAARSLANAYLDQAKRGVSPVAAFRFASKPVKLIVYVWFNDEDTLRKAGSKTDVYEVFRHMLSRGQVPGGIKELLAESTS